MRVFKLGVWSAALALAACSFDPSGGTSDVPPGFTGGGAGGSGAGGSGGSGGSGGVGGSGGIGGSGGSGGSGGVGGSGGSGGSGGIGGSGGSGGNGGNGGNGGGNNTNPCALLAAGARVCVDSGHSGTCELLSGVLGPVADRTCPPSSVCTSGYCQAPPPPRACAKDRDCASGDVCNLFVKPDGKLGGFCAPPFPGTSGAQSGCSNNSDCGTGFCADDGGGNPVCLSLCGGNGDCGGSGAQCKSFNLPSSIEGATTSALKSCFPNGD